MSAKTKRTTPTEPVAPEVLAALKSARDWLCSFSMPPTSTIQEKQEMVAIIEAAIAKAEGSDSATAGDMPLANARLIAAAPDLLAVVATLSRLQLGKGGYCSMPLRELVEQAVAAIAKAQGATT